jgi:hypothetical protein
LGNGARAGSGARERFLLVIVLAWTE